MPAEGRTAAERLIQQNKVVAVFGEFHSPVALAEMEVYHKYGMPFMACDVWSDQITAKGLSRGVPQRAGGVADRRDHRPVDRRGRLQERRDHRREGRCRVWPRARWWPQELTKANIKFTAVDADPNLTDFTAQILRFKSNSPPYDFFLSIYAEAGAYPMIRQAHDLGFAPTANCGIYNSGGEAVDPTFWENVGEAGKYLVTENVGLPKAAWNDKTKAFVAAYKAKHNADPSGAVMESYDGAWLLFDAIRTAGSTEPKAIIDALENTSYVGARGKYSFSTSHEPAWHYHQFLEAPLSILQYAEVKQGQADAPIVWPRQFATVPYIYKKPGS